MPSPTIVIDLTTASTPPSLSTPAPPIIAIPLSEAKGEDLTIEAVLHKEIAIVREETVRVLMQKICREYPEVARMVADVLLIQEGEERYFSTEESSDEEADVKIEGEDTKETEAQEYSTTRKSTKGGGDSNASDETPKDSSSNLAAHTTTTNGGEEKTTGIKRYRGKSAICDNCKEQYDVSNNHKGDCLWHEGITITLQNDSGDLYIDRRGKFWDDHDEKILDRIQLEDMRNEYSQGFAWSCCGTSGDDDGCKAGRHVERILEESKRARYG